MSTNDVQERWGRETRLLVLVVVVSLAVLLLLARFRFPAPNLTVAVPAPGPLAGLAGRSAFDELGSSLNTLLTRVGPALVSVRVDATPEPASRPARRRAAADPRPAAEPERPRAFAALRLDAGLALMYVPAGMSPVALDTGAPVEIVARDDARALAVVRLSVPGDAGAAPSAGPFAGFAYVGQVDATAAGLNVRPAFVGRIEPTADPAWSGPVYAEAGSPQLALGSFVFTLDGRLVGLVTAGTAGPIVVPIDTLTSAADEIRQSGAGLS